MDMPTAPTAVRPICNSTDLRTAPPLIALCLSCLACAGLAGCASGNKSATIPSDGPTMAEIYRQHMTGAAERPTPSQPGSGPDARPQRGLDESASRTGSQQAAADEIDNRFARLPNPDLVMYVAPHQSANGRYPVPGYSTVFPLYETVEYAMPGELPWHRGPLAQQAR